MGTPSLRCTELPSIHQPASWALLYSNPTYSSPYLTPHVHPSVGVNKGFSWERGEPCPLPNLWQPFRDLSYTAPKLGTGE